MPNFKDYKKLIETGKKLLNEYKIARNKTPMYYVDAFNNIVKDAFGNPIVGTCQNCQGHGVEIVELV